MSNKTTNIIAALLLILMFIFAFTSMRGISATMDEQSHIPAGYSYLTQRDFRINPEHPPLIKDLAAIPLLFLNLNFPKEHPSWTSPVNGQWWFGNKFLYHSNNNPDQVIFWSRIPMLLVLVFFGWFLFYWAKKLGGNKIALLTLTLFTFSPNFLAHGRLVTTDVAAALGAVLGTFFWLKWLKEPSKKNILLGGLVFGTVMLFKFSLALLIPFFLVITFLYAWLFSRSILKYIGLAFLVGLIGLIIIIWPVYQFHVSNYPIKRQLNDTKQILKSNGIIPLKKLCIWMSGKSLLRAPAHYLLGLLMATQRVASGNTVYFMGMVSGSGWWYYFPVVYFLKVPLALHLLTLIVLLGSVTLIRKPFWIETKERLKKWSKENFVALSMLIFLAIYWFTSIKGSLNIGIRHILPTFPFIYLLIGLGTKNLMKNKKSSFKKGFKVLILILLSWYIIASIIAWPHYLSFFNEAIGSKNGYKYVVDSNYDWGQDLKRLNHWVNKNNINKIYVDYFGGGDPEYYLGNKYIKWEGTNSNFPSGNYLAVSATLLQGGRGNPVPGYNQPTNYYNWLNNEKLVAKAGNSIFIYYIK